MAEREIADVQREAVWRKGIEDAAVGCEDWYGAVNRELRVQGVVGCDHPLVREREGVPNEHLNRYDGHRDASEISPRIPDLSRREVLLESALPEIVADLGKKKGGREGLIGPVDQPGQQEPGLVGEDFLERPLQSDGGVEDVVQTLSTFVSETTDVVGAVLERPVKACEALASGVDPFHQALRNPGLNPGQALDVLAHFPLLIGREALDLFDEFCGAHGGSLPAIILLLHCDAQEG